MATVSSGIAIPAPSNAPASSPAAPPAASSAPGASSAPAPAPSAPPAPSSAAPAPAPAPTSAPVASSAPAPAPPPPAPASSAPAAPPPPPPPPVATSVVTAPSAAPSVTEVQTSFITVTPSATVPGQTPEVVVVTSLITPTQPTGKATASQTSGAAVSPTAGSNESQDGTSKSSTGLSTGGKTAIAVVVPILVVALLALAGIIFWRKRKQRQGNEEERRKEVEEYGYNPNHDPTLPPAGAQMAEDDSGYRGWGNTATSSGRKASTTLASGMTYSDSTSNPDPYNPNSPTNGAYSDAHSGDPLVHRRETMDMDADGIGALGAVGAGAVAANSAHNPVGVHRGISNASSTYSTADHSDNSADYPGMAASNPHEYYADQGYYQANPYGDDPYGAGGQPIIRDVSARRNTTIQNPSFSPQQGNAGISQNF